jgi:prophage antirepressor-like protein
MQKISIPTPIALDDKGLLNSTESLLVTQFKQFNIEVYGTREEPLFKAKEIGDMLGIVNIRDTIIKFNSRQKVVGYTDTLGGRQETAFLTEAGMYKVIFKSKKEFAEDFQNHVFDILKEIRLTGKYNLEQQLAEKDKMLVEQSVEHAANLESEKTLVQQAILLREFGSHCSLVYIVKVAELSSGMYVVRIGESRDGVSARFEEHQKTYSPYPVQLLNCFLVSNSRKFETFLHGKLSKHKYKQLPGHENEKELFLVGKDLTYAEILKKVSLHIQHYNNNLILENENLKLQNEALKIFSKDTLNMDSLTDFISLLTNQYGEVKAELKVLKDQNNQILEKLNSTPKVGTFSNRAQGVPRLQQINPENLFLVNVYESINASIEANPNLDLKSSSISKAVAKNTIYRGFRWNTIERVFDPQVVNIEPTVVTQVQNIGYIAKLNSEKTEILNVYLNRHVASLANGYDSPAGLDECVKKFKMARDGCYYALYHNCLDELKQNFETTHGVLKLYKNGIGKFNENGDLVAVFTSKADCHSKDDEPGNKALTRALATNNSCNGFFYTFIGPKVKIINK